VCARDLDRRTGWRRVTERDIRTRGFFCLYVADAFHYRRRSRRRRGGFMGPGNVKLINLYNCTATAAATAATRGSRGGRLSGFQNVTGSQRIFGRGVTRVCFRILENLSRSGFEMHYRIGALYPLELHCG